MNTRGKIRGKVRSKDGKPLKGQVSITPKIWTCGAAGDYETDPLPAGTFTVIASASGYHSRRVDVQVSDNTILALDFELIPEAT